MSAAPDFARYEYRYSAGSKFDSDTAATLGTVPNINTLTFSTAAGLLASGSQIAVKCYVVTDTGNEKGSNTLIVTRA